MLLLSSKPCIVGKLFSIGCCICHHFEEHQTIHHRHTLHAMPLAQAVTTVVAQPRANACKLHCVEHFYSTTQSLTNVMAHMLHIALFKDLCQYVILDQICLFALLSFAFSTFVPFLDLRKNDTLNQYIETTQKQIVCVPLCLKSWQHPKHFPTSPLGQYCAGSHLAKTTP